MNQLKPSSFVKNNGVHTAISCPYSIGPNTITTFRRDDNGYLQTSADFGANYLDVITAEDARLEKKIDAIPTKVRCRVTPKFNRFSPCSFKNITSFTGNNVWTDGQNIYYSGAAASFILDESTLTWTQINFSGLTSFIGNYVWSAYDTIYYSAGASQYYLSPSTRTWFAQDWGNFEGSGIASSFFGYNIWSDGEDIYCSAGNNKHWVLDYDNEQWDKVNNFVGFTSFYGNDLWTDGETIYCSAGNANQYYLSGKRIWYPTSWIGVTNPSATQIWSDGENIYYSSPIGETYKLKKGTHTWELEPTIVITGAVAQNIWSSGNNIYATYNGSNYKWQKNRSASCKV